MKDIKNISDSMKRELIKKLEAIIGETTASMVIAKCKGEKEVNIKALEAKLFLTLNIIGEGDKNASRNYLISEMDSIFMLADLILMRNGNVALAFTMSQLISKMADTASSAVDEIKALNMEVKTLKDVIEHQDEIIGTL